MPLQIQERLSWGPYATFVPAKKEPVYNWLYYKEGFSPQLAKALMNMMELEAKTVISTPGGMSNQETVLLDPFCGVGTTLLAAKQRGIKSIGIDIMPLAILASRAKTNNYDVNRLKEIASELIKESEYTAKISTNIENDSAGALGNISTFSSPVSLTTNTCFSHDINEQAQINSLIVIPDIVKRAFPKKSLKELLELRHAIGKMENGEIKDFLLLALVRAATEASWAYKDGEVIKIRKRHVPPIRKAFGRVINRMLLDLKNLRPKGDGKVEVRQGDAKFLNLEDSSVHGVITSPPYLNIMDYTKAYAIENWIITGKIDAETRFIGKDQDGRWSEKKYFEDMKMVLHELFRVCALGARIAFVIGNAWMDGKEIECDVRLAEMGQEVGFEPEKIIVVNRRPVLVKRTKKVGATRESIVLIRKNM